jgi:hypothetical protein
MYNLIMGAVEGFLGADRMLEAGAPLLVRTTPNWKAGTLSGLLRRAAHDGLAPLLTTTRELQDHGGRVDRVWRERIHLPWRRFLVPRPYRVFVVVNADSWSDSPQTKQLHWHLSRWLAEWPGSAVAVVVNAADQDDAPVGTQMSLSETSSVRTAATDKELREALGLSSTPEGKDLVSAVALLNGRSFHRFEMPLRLYSRRSLWVAALI